MGLLNPEKHRELRKMINSNIKLNEGRDGNLLAVSQSFAKYWFLSVSNFFEAQALMEDVVISESLSESPNYKAFKEMQRSLTRVSENLEEAIKVYERNKMEIHCVEDWQPEYYHEMIPRIRELKGISDGLFQLAHRDSFSSSLKKGQIQKSVWHDNENHKARLLSIEFVNILNSILSRHLTAVVTTNQ